MRNLLRSFLVLLLLLIGGYGFQHEGQRHAAAQTSRLTYGSTVEGAIAAPGQAETWVLDGVRGDVIRLRVRVLEGDLQPALTIRDPDNTLLLDVTWSQANIETFDATTTLRVSGAQRITVDGSGASTGRYALTVTLLAAGSAQTDAAQASDQLIYGETITGEITDERFREFWTMRGVRGDVIDLHMVRTGGDLQAALALIAPDGRMIAFQSATADQTAITLRSVRLPLSGLYSIIARRAGDDLGENGTSAGTYELELILRQAGSPAEALLPESLAAGETTNGALTADNPAALYAVEASGVMAVYVETDVPLRLVRVRAMTPDEIELTQVSGLSPVQFSLPAGNLPEIWLEVGVDFLTPDSRPLTYALFATSLQTAVQTSRPLSFDRPRTVASDPGAERELWHFRADEGDMIRLSVVPEKPLPQGTVTVYTPDGTTAATVQVGARAALPLTLQASGMYEVAISTEIAQAGYYLDIVREGARGLSFEQVVDPVDKGELPGSGGVPLEDVVENGVAHRWWLDVRDSGTWLFRLTRPDQESADSLAPLGIMIRKPDGALLAAEIMRGVAQAAIANVQLDGPGRYDILIFAPQGESQSLAYALATQPVEGGRVVLPVERRGVVGDQASADVWQFMLAPGVTFHAALESSTPDIEPVLLGPDGSRVPANLIEQPDGSRLLAAPIEVGGLHTLLIRQIDTAAREVYTLRMELDVPFTTEPFSAGGNGPGEPTPVPDDADPQAVDISSLLHPPLNDVSDLRGDARALTRGVLLRGTAELSALQDTWAFPVIAGETLGFSVRGLGTDSYPSLRIVTPDGVTIAARMESGEHSIYLAHQFQTSGTYYLLVGLAKPGAYTLWPVTLGSEALYPQTVLEGHPIEFGETVSGELLASDDVARFFFYAGINTAVELTALRTAGEMPLSIALYRANGSLLSQIPLDAQDSMGELRQELDATGLYRIEAASSDAGAEQLHARFAIRLSQIRGARPVIIGGGTLHSIHTGVLTSQQREHHWLFRADAGEKVSIELTSLLVNAPIPSQVALADTQGEIFLSREIAPDASELALRNVVLPQTGVYRVIVGGRGAAGALYSIELTRAGPANGFNGGALAYNQTVGGLLHADDPLDIWTLSGSAGDTIAVTLQRAHTSDATLSLQIRDQNGRQVTTLIAPVDDGAVVGEGIVLPSNGHYSVVVGDPLGHIGAPVAYELSVVLRESGAQSMGAPLHYGQAALGRLTDADPSDTWLFEGHQGDAVTLSVESSDDAPAGSPVRPSLALVSTDWHIAAVAGRSEVLVQAQPSDGAPVTISSFILPLDGTYAIQVQTTNGEGDYVLRIEADPEYASAVYPAVVGQVREGQVMAAGDQQDVWSFEGVQDTYVTIEMRPDSRSRFAPGLKLLGDTGEVLASTSATIGETARISAFRLPRSATYTVQASLALGELARGQGRYTLSIVAEPLAEEQARETAYGVLRRGFLDGDIPAERWSFAGEAGDVVRLTAEATSQNLDPVLVLRAPDGTRLVTKSAADGRQTAITYQLPVAGRYEVIVTRYRGEFGQTQGNYALTVARVYQSSATGADTAPRLQYGGQIHAALDNDDPVAEWFFDGVRADVVGIRVWFPVSDLPLTLTLTDPGGNVLARGLRNLGETEITGFELPASGVYRIEIQRLPERGSDNFTPYHLALTLESAAPTAMSQGGVLVPGDTVAGIFSAAGSDHVWFVEAEMGENLLIELARLKGILPNRLQLSAPDGQILLDIDLARDPTLQSPIIMKLPQTGIYRLRLSPPVDFPGSTYRLRVIRQPDAVEGQGGSEDGLEAQPASETVGLETGAPVG